jgi:DNA-binding NarL/FixJ family response regulator
MLTTSSVLLADVAPGVRTMLRLDLERDGRFIVVGEAANRAEAVALSSTLQPDAVVLDLAMPMDGADPIEAIQRRSPRSKIIALAGRDAGDSEAAKADACLDPRSHADHISSAVARACGRPH